MWGDGWEVYLEGRESMDFLKTTRPQGKNLNVSDTGWGINFLFSRLLHRLSYFLYYPVCLLLLFLGDGVGNR